MAGFEHANGEDLSEGGSATSMSFVIMNPSLVADGRDCDNWLHLRPEAVAHPETVR